MLIFESLFTPKNNSYGPANYPAEQLLYFDIETTGLSADTSSLYLIGCLYYRDNTWHTIQWFADDYQSEKALLTAFFDFMKDFSVLIHYNGTGFDIPYLQKKCKQHKLSFSFEAIQSLDIYKELTPYKKLLPLPNLKQKTIEGILGIQREDKYDGGQLIQVYVEYIHNKFKKTTGCEDCLSLLLLHNREDLEGLLQASILLLSPELIEKDTQCTEETKEEALRYSLKFPYQLTSTLTLEKGAIELTLPKASSIGTLTLHPFTGELKYFYPNYKDYYYLPIEDTAIHKSVASYVEKEYREKAKACNCYTKHSGVFLPIPPGFSLPEDVPLFRQDYKDKVLWFEIKDDFLNNTLLLLNYLKEALK